MVYTFYTIVMTMSDLMKKPERKIITNRNFFLFLLGFSATLSVNMPFVFGQNTNLSKSKPLVIIDSKVYDSRFGAERGKPRRTSIGQELEVALNKAGIELVAVEPRIYGQANSWLRDIGSVNSKGIFIYTSLKTDAKILSNAADWLVKDLKLTGSTLNPDTLESRKSYLSEIQAAGYKSKEVHDMFIQGGDILYFQGKDGDNALIGINTLYINIYIQNSLDAIKLYDLDGITPTLLESKLAESAAHKADKYIQQKLPKLIKLHRIFTNVLNRIDPNLYIGNSDFNPKIYDAIADAMKEEAKINSEIPSDTKSPDYIELEQQLIGWTIYKKDTSIKNFTPESFAADEWSHLIGKDVAALNLTHAEKVNILAQITHLIRVKIAKSLDVKSVFLSDNRNFHTDLNVGTTFVIEKDAQDKSIFKTVIAISNPKLTVNAIIKAIRYYREKGDFITANKLQEQIKGAINLPDFNQTIYNPNEDQLEVSSSNIDPKLFLNELKLSGVTVVFVPGKLPSLLDNKWINLINLIPVITKDELGNPVSTIITSTSGYEQLDKNLAEDFIDAGVQLIIPIDASYLFTTKKGSLRCLSLENPLYNLRQQYQPRTYLQSPFYINQPTSYTK